MVVLLLSSGWMQEGDIRFNKYLGGLKILGGLAPWRLEIETAGAPLND
jgi:hypothetical protein